MDDEFDNFMDRVTQVERLVTQLRSSDDKVADDARRRADALLGPKPTTPPSCGERRQAQGGVEGARDVAEERPLHGHGDGGLRCRAERTVINQKAFDRIAGSGSDPAEMSKECFMAQVERDAENRAKDRRERKQRAGELRRRATDAFRQKHFEKALELYSKAIEETRDSAMLYENRALTSLNLELYRRTVEDCDSALRLEENSLKALLYKAKALHRMEDEEGSERCIEMAMEKHPHQKDIITNYVETWRQGDQVPKDTGVDKKKFRN